MVCNHHWESNHPIFYEIRDYDVRHEKRLRTRVGHISVDNLGETYCKSDCNGSFCPQILTKVVSKDDDNGDRDKNELLHQYKNPVAERLAIHNTVL